MGLATWAFAGRWLGATLLLLAGTFAKAEPTTPTVTDGDEVILGLPADRDSDEQGPFEITIASYNVQARPLFDRPQEKLPLISPLLNAYDVVLIQECFRRHDLLWSQAAFPNKIYFGRLMTPSKVTGSGLSILTKLPVKEAVMEHFRDVGELQNRPASKGILLVRMQLERLPLDVYNTHMEAGDTKAAQAARLGQAKQMIELVNRCSPADRTVIVMGDFNMGPRREGKPWRDYSPNHYSNEADMRDRTAAFEVLRAGLKLKDASDILHGPVDDGIERLLYRAGTDAAVEPLECFVETKKFRRKDGTSLSDGAPLVVKLRIEAK